MIKNKKRRNPALTEVKNRKCGISALMKSVKLVGNADKLGGIMWYVVSFMAGTMFGVMIMCLCVVSGNADKRGGRHE